MKIAIYVPSWPPGFAANGIVTYASYLVPALRELGHEVFVLTYRKMAEDDDPYTIDLRRFVPSHLTLWHRAISWMRPDLGIYRAVTAGFHNAIRELVTKYKIDVLEMEESFGWSFSISRLGLLPVVVRLHGPWFLTGPFGNINNSHHRDLLEGRALRTAACVTSPTSEVLAAVTARYNLNVCSRVIPNPIKARPRSEIWRVDACDQNSFLFVGRFDKLKGADLILRAFADLSSLDPKLKLIFVGADEGIRIEGRVVKFEEFVRSNLPQGVQSQIEFRGLISRSNVMALRSRCFATVVASRYEVFPYTVLESMSVGCPLIATAVGGIPEAIRSFQNGVLVPSENSAAIASALRKLLLDRNQAAQLGRTAWLDCRRSLDPDLIAKKTLESYREAVDRF